jgi:hypothetical protein
MMRTLELVQAFGLPSPFRGAFAPLPPDLWDARLRNRGRAVETARKRVEVGTSEPVN